jgi:hypothetical protein
MMRESWIMDLGDIVNIDDHPISNAHFTATKKQELAEKGIVVLENFITASAAESIRLEGLENQDKVYAKTEKHNAFLSPTDESFPANHPRNRLITSSKGCLTDDQITARSTLRELYNSAEFKTFLCTVLDEEQLYPYADPLSSINLHFAQKGQELGWHFDNSSFAITLMIQPPEKGSEFEFVRDVRDADAGEMNFDTVGDILDGKTKTETLTMDAGPLVLFRGRNSMHRVRPNLGSRVRMLAVLAYNSEPGISLSEEARKTFYGRTG